MLAQIVRFRSAMSDEDVVRTYGERAPRYRALEGLRQKYYLRFDTGEHGAVYVWDSRDALDAFRASELARTIPTAYQVRGEPDIQVAEVVMKLRKKSSTES